MRNGIRVREEEKAKSEIYTRIKPKYDKFIHTEAQYFRQHHAISSDREAMQFLAKALGAIFLGF
jgi:hypothetical protein